MARRRPSFRCPRGHTPGYAVEYLDAQGQGFDGDGGLDSFDVAVREARSACRANDPQTHGAEVHAVCWGGPSERAVDPRGERVLYACGSSRVRGPAYDRKLAIAERPLFGARRRS